MQSLDLMAPRSSNKPDDKPDPEVPGGNPADDAEANEAEAEADETTETADAEPSQPKDKVPAAEGGNPAPPANSSQPVRPYGGKRGSQRPPHIWPAELWTMFSKKQKLAEIQKWENFL